MSDFRFYKSYLFHKFTCIWRALNQQRQKRSDPKAQDRKCWMQPARPHLQLNSRTPKQQLRIVANTWRKYSCWGGCWLRFVKRSYRNLLIVRCACKKGFELKIVPKCFLSLWPYQQSILFQTDPFWLVKRKLCS